MRKSFVLAVLLSVAATVTLAHYPGQIKIGEAASKQPPVSFNHARHGDTYVKDCTTCHHQEKGLTKAQTDTREVRKCATCHLKPQGKIGTMADMSMTRNPMHIRCIGCHKAEKKNGPTACTGCHKKG